MSRERRSGLIEALAELSASRAAGDEIAAVQKRLDQVAELVEAIAAKMGIDLDAAEPADNFAETRRDRGHE